MRIIPREVRKVNTNSRFHRELRKRLTLSDLQKLVIQGTLLGDGSLISNSSETNYRLQIEHSDQQKADALWKYEIFKDFVLNQPQYLVGTKSWKFRTVSHPNFLTFRIMFYRNGKKILPDDLTFLKNPVVLAIWFMDDGCYSPGRGYILNTQNFTFQENVRLRTFLEKELGLSVAIHRDENYFRLFIHKRSMTEFETLVGSYIQPVMSYKLSNPVET